MKMRCSLAVLALCSMLTLTGCNYSFFMIERDDSIQDNIQKEEDSSSFSYMNGYQDYNIIFPNGWKIDQDGASYLKASNKVATLTITKKEGKAAMSVLPFPQKEGDVQLFISNQSAYIITNEDGTTRTADYSLEDFDAGSITFDSDREGLYYNFTVTRTDGFTDHFIGAKLDRKAYLFVITAPQGQKQEDLFDYFEQFQFINNPELTATFLTATSDMETIDLSELKDKENEKTCLSSVNVRTEPNSSSSQVIGGLSQGDKIIVTGEEGNWYSFEYQGRTAYVYKDYFE